MITWTPNQKVIGEYLRGNPDLRAALENLARAGLEFARSIAPVGDPDTDKRAGQYLNSLYGEVHKGPTRMTARVGSTDYKRYWIEYGAVHTEKQMVLRRALDAMSREI